MLRSETDTDRLQLQLDVVMTRNAHLLVALRHTIHTLHLSGDPGHQRSRRWVQCPHKDCRRAQELAGEVVAA
ncbi:MAG TPA: hypothetical protein VEU08_17275 [Vicinamibacterales bacterium]|nr:hypothetical protein [Vicinamibacterales bacterium]